jgi:hypothetical protein
MFQAVPHYCQLVMPLLDNQIHREDSHLLLTERSLLNITLTHDSLVHREDDLSYDESFDARSTSNFLHVIPLLLIGLCVAHKCR